MKKIKHPISHEDIVTLLAQSKAGEAGYPPSLLAARRAEFLKKAASMQSQGGEGPKDTPSQGNTSSSPTTVRNISTTGKSIGGVHSASQVLTGILYAIVGVMTTVILAEVTYLYKDQIRELFLPGREEVVSPVTLPPYSSPTASDLSATPSPTQTPTTTLFPLQSTDAAIGKTALPGNAATPVSPGSTQTKPGNRFGNTTRTPVPGNTSQSVVSTPTNSGGGSQTKTPKP